MFTFSARSLRNLEGVHPALVQLAHEALKHSRVVDWLVIEGVRTLKRQRQLVAAGASTTLNSRHIPGADNLGKAIDVAAWVGRVDWSLNLYYQIAETFQASSKLIGVPVRWGGAWMRLDTTEKKPHELVEEYVASRRLAGTKAFIDAGHFELPASVFP